MCRSVVQSREDKLYNPGNGRQITPCHRYRMEVQVVVWAGVSQVAPVLA